jgi:hypothetical protein
MSSLLLNLVLLLTAGVGGAWLLLNLIGANLYDVRETRKKRKYDQHPHAARYRQRPLISVIVQVRNDRQELEQTIASLTKSSYRKLEIIIADNTSERAAKKIARTLIAQYPKRRIKLFASRSADSEVVVRKAYKAHGKGTLIMSMAAGQTVGKQTISQAVRHFNAENNLDTLIFNERIDSALSVLGLLQKYEYLLRMRAKKSLSLLKSANPRDKNDVVICKKEVFTKPAQALRTFYAADALVCTPSAGSLDALLRQRYELQAGRLRTWREQPRPFATATGIAALLAPVLFGYFVYVALSLHQPIFFVLCLVAVTIVLLLAIWGDEHFKPQEKLAYSASIPITYGLFCLFALLLPIALAAEAITSIEWRDLSYGFAVDASSPPQEERG